MENKFLLIAPSGCKKTECIRHEAYKKWEIGNDALNYCIKCKHAHASQYKRKYTQPDIHCSDWSYIETAP